MAPFNKSGQLSMYFLVKDQGNKDTENRIYVQLIVGHYLQFEED